MSHVSLIIRTSIIWYILDSYELTGMLEAANNTLEGAENHKNWIRVQCMYGGYVSDDI